MARLLVPTLYENMRVLPVSGGTIMGEASEVSTISMDGVVAADGGVPNNGWGINGHGHDGFITSTPINGKLYSVETFDQVTNAIAKTIYSGKKRSFSTPKGGIYGNDLGLLRVRDTKTTKTIAFKTLNPVAKGTVGSDWTPPSVIIQSSALNQANDTGLFLGPIPGSGRANKRIRVFTSNITANTFGPLIDVSGPLSSFGNGHYYAVAQNTKTNMGFLAAGDTANSCGQPTLVTVNLKNGKVHSHPGIGSGLPEGLAVDSQTNTAMAPTVCDNTVGIYHINGNSVQSTWGHLPAGPSGTGSYNGFYTAADPVHGLFLIEQTVAPDSLSNNNSLSVVYGLNEKGQVQTSYERFNLYNTYLKIEAHKLQLNPSLGIGYIVGVGQIELEPFRYMNNAPVASAGTLTTDENKSASGTLEATDPDGTPLAFSIVDQPSHGTVKLTDASKGSYTYTPDHNYVGSDSFTFKASNGRADSNAATIGITVKGVNHPPTASDGTLTTDENESASGTLKARDPDGDQLTFSIVDEPQHGSVKLDDATTGAYTYTPSDGYSGSDSFTFKANDGHADSNVAAISITVTSVNRPPVANDGTLTTDENKAAGGTLKASDPDGDSLTFGIASQPAHGSVTLNDKATGAYTYTPTSGYSGKDSFTFKASDGQADSNVATISITVNAVTPPPPPPPPSKGGGGGAFGWLALVALMSLVLSGVLMKRR